MSSFILSCTSAKHLKTASAQQTKSLTSSQSYTSFSNDEPETMISVDLSQKKLYVLKGADTLRSYSVAVGQSKYPTPIGNFKISRIDWNPDWNPPKTDWAKNKKYAAPGSASNPVGRVKLVYRGAYAIHGTNDTSSLGRALSHGCVRMSNEDAIELAKLVMEETGTIKPPEWYDQVLTNKRKKISVRLNKEMPLTNKK